MDMKVYLYNEEGESVRMTLSSYNYDKLVVEDNRKGIYDVQETLTFHPENFDDILLFLRCSGKEVNLSVYADENYYMTLPEIEIEATISNQIKMIKVKTYKY